MKSLSVILLCAVATAADLPNPMMSYYSWNWGKGSAGEKGANVGVAFTGLVKIQDAIDGYEKYGCGGKGCPPLVEPKLLSLGGGNSAGAISAQVLYDI